MNLTEAAAVALKVSEACDLSFDRQHREGVVVI